MRNVIRNELSKDFRKTVCLTLLNKLRWPGLVCSEQVLLYTRRTLIGYLLKKLVIKSQGSQISVYCKTRTGSKIWTFWKGVLTLRLLSSRTRGNLLCGSAVSQSLKFWGWGSRKISNNKSNLHIFILTKMLKIYHKMTTSAFTWWGVRQLTSFSNTGAHAITRCRFFRQSHLPFREHSFNWARA